MAAILKDRKEFVSINGNVYVLSLCWGKEGSNTPIMATIQKNKKPYANIGFCFKGVDGFIVNNAQANKAKWHVNFRQNISTIPLKRILERIPL